MLHVFSKLVFSANLCVKIMRILGIESSCDETALAIVREEGGVFTVEHNLVTSQIDLHAVYGGVVPELAARQHVDAAFLLLDQIGVPRNGEGIDAIAVTYGPRLVPALRIGVELAKTLAWAWKKPIVPVNHLEGHIYSVWLGEGRRDESFPILSLLVSGKHTEIIQAKEEGVYTCLGATRDDASGEAFDKAARLLGFGYPGGPALSKCAKEGNKNAIPFPRPMRESGDFDFSFSGLKTALAVYLQTHEENRASLPDICASYEEAIVDVLAEKTFRAILETQPKTIILAWGVSANGPLRDRLAAMIMSLSEEMRPTLLFPPLRYTGDNAAMIAAAGAARFARGFTHDPLTLEADPNLSLV